MKHVFGRQVVNALIHFNDGLPDASHHFNDQFFSILGYSFQKEFSLNFITKAKRRET